MTIFFLYLSGIYDIAECWAQYRYWININCLEVNLYIWSIILRYEAAKKHLSSVKLYMLSQLGCKPIKDKKNYILITLA